MRERENSTEHNQPQGDTLRCPQCGSEEFHLLADNRRQCRRCRKKFSLPKHTERLDSAALERIAELFWQFVPADQAAERIGLNRKTVQKYYGGIRRGLQEENDQVWQRTCSEEGPISPCFLGDLRKTSERVIFWVQIRKETVHLLFPDNTPAQTPVERPGSVVTAPNERILKQANIEHYLLRGWPVDAPGDPEQGRLGTHFWNYAKGNLPRYRGGYKKNFRLFMAEMEFRFNHRADMSTPACLPRICHDLSTRQTAGAS